MATIDQLSSALAKADAAGNVEDARILAGEIRKLQGASQPEKRQSLGSTLAQMGGDLAAGALRGAGSIGATILAPVDAAARAMGIENSFIGRTDRREAMDQALKELGANPESIAYQGGKLGTEIAGTAGVGGILAKGASMIPGLAQKAPALVEALRTGGISTGGVGGLAGTGARMTGGAATGGTAAALVNPEDAGIGAALGAGIGGAASAGAKLAQKAIVPGAQEARNLGYVIPPSQAGGGLTSRLAEGLSGKLSTAQVASSKNQSVTNKLAAQSLGLPDDAPINMETLDKVRAEAGKAYEALAGLPKVEPKSANPLSNIKASEGFDPAKSVFELRKARNDADAYYKAYGRSADPEALAKAKSFRAKASGIEKELETYAMSQGANVPGSWKMLDDLRNARETIAKTYTIEKALNPTTGTIDAQKLAAELRKGKPLTGELKQAAEFASQFPKAAQTPEKMGSLPGLSPLDWAGGGIAGTLSALTGGSALVGAPLLARPAVRSAILSNFAQDRMMRQGAMNPYLANALRAQNLGAMAAD